MDSPLWILRMASDRIMLISTVLILGHWSFCISCGIVFVTTTYRKKKWSGKRISVTFYSFHIGNVKGSFTDPTKPPWLTKQHCTLLSGSQSKEEPCVAIDLMYPWILKALSLLPFIHSATQAPRKGQKYPTHWRERCADTDSPASHHFPLL